MSRQGPYQFLRFSGSVVDVTAVAHAQNFDDSQKRHRLNSQSDISDKDTPEVAGIPQPSVPRRTGILSQISIFRKTRRRTDQEELAALCEQKL